MNELKIVWKEGRKEGIVARTYNIRAVFWIY
jgi:hypothetical protein